jgi:hypothetical protein
MHTRRGLRPIKAHYQEETVRLAIQEHRRSAGISRPRRRRACFHSTSLGLAQLGGGSVEEGDGGALPGGEARSIGALRAPPLL